LQHLSFSEYVLTFIGTVYLTLYTLHK